MLKNGFIALSSVLLISAIVLSISITVSLLAIGESQAGFALFKGEESLNFVEGCAEDALLKLNEASAYAGGNITRPEGTCTVSVSSAGNNYTLTVSTSNTDYKRTIQISATRGTTVVINSWLEI